MVTPARFGYNPQAAASNSFMEADSALDSDGRMLVAQRAQQEFTGFVEVLRQAGIHVIVIEDHAEPHTPDAVFPNNWISTHDDGTIVLYPMEAPNRRLERRTDVVQSLISTFHYRCVMDFSPYEQHGIYLEGTGSLVLDRANRIAYANISSRMNECALHDWATRMGFTAVSFAARRTDGGSIYHTNVMMAVGVKTAVVCAAAVTNERERAALLDSLRASGKAVVEISHEQMDNFAGNLLQVRNKQGSRFWVMSSRAYSALTPDQRKTLQTDSEILHAPLDVIERHGGGSARCMLAEIFPPSPTIR
jgi:hypothetical protein